MAVVANTRSGNTQLPVAVESKPPRNGPTVPTAQPQPRAKPVTEAEPIADRVRKLNMVMANGNAPPPTPATKAQTIAVDGGANRMPK